jgi:hypothetical protein
MAQPVLGGVTIEYPTDWEITPIIGETSAVTLSGKVRTDVLYRRYKYTLNYNSKMWIHVDVKTID